MVSIATTKDLLSWGRIPVPINYKDYIVVMIEVLVNELIIQ